MDVRMKEIYGLLRDAVQITWRLFTQGCRGLFVTHTESLKLFFASEETARPCALHLKLTPIKIKCARAFLVNDSWHSYYQSFTLTVTLWSFSAIIYLNVFRGTYICYTFRCRHA